MLDFFSKVMYNIIEKCLIEVVMNEKDIKHNVLIDISMYNTVGAFVPSAYQRMIMSMIEEHLDILKIGEKELMEKHGISWVLLSSSIKIIKRLSLEN